MIKKAVVFCVLLLIIGLMIFYYQNPSIITKVSVINKSKEQTSESVSNNKDVLTNKSPSKNKNKDKKESTEEVSAYTLNELTFEDVIFKMDSFEEYKKSTSDSNIYTQVNIELAISALAYKGFSLKEGFDTKFEELKLSSKEVSLLRIFSESKDYNLLLQKNRFDQDYLNFENLNLVYGYKNPVITYKDGTTVGIPNKKVEAIRIEKDEDEANLNDQNQLKEETDKDISEPSAESNQKN